MKSGASPLLNAQSTAEEEAAVVSCAEKLRKTMSKRKLFKLSGIALPTISQIDEADGVRLEAMLDSGEVDAVDDYLAEYAKIRATPEELQYFYATSRMTALLLAEQVDDLTQHLSTSWAAEKAHLATIVRLQHQLARLKHEKFGTKSEKAELLDDAASPTEPDAPERERHAQDGEQITLRNKPARKSFPAHLPRQRFVLPSPTSCSCCNGTNLRKLGEDITESLEVIPRSWKVVQYVREKFSCRDCEKVSQTPAPFHVIPRAYAGPSLLAMITDQRYGQHQPLNRQSERYKSEGIELSVSTLVGLQASTAEALKPLHDRLIRYVMSGQYLYGDDTTVLVLAKRKATTGRFWTYIRDERSFNSRSPPAAIFAYSPDRRSEHIGLHLANWSGLLHSDAYAGFAAVSKALPAGTIQHAYCWAHARRQFFKVANVNRVLRKRQSCADQPVSPIAREAVDRIDALFAIEREIKGLSEGERLRVRQARSVPLTDELKNWLEIQQARLSKHSDTAKAINYLLSRWEGFTTFLADGRISLDNNGAERALRTIAVGRRNWTFCGSHRGGEVAAMMYGLIGTCRLNNVDPQAWLADVLCRIAGHSANKLDELLPWNWAEAQPQLQLEAA